MVIEGSKVEYLNIVNSLSCRRSININDFAF